MKKNILNFSLVIIGLLVFSSCKAEDNKDLKSYSFSEKVKESEKKISKAMFDEGDKIRCTVYMEFVELDECKDIKKKIYKSDDKINLSCNNNVDFSNNRYKKIKYIYDKCTGKK